MCALHGRQHADLCLHPHTRQVLMPRVACLATLGVCLLTFPMTCAWLVLEQLLTNRVKPRSALLDIGRASYALQILKRLLGSCVKPRSVLTGVLMTSDALQVLKRLLATLFGPGSELAEAEQHACRRLLAFAAAAVDEG